MCVCHYKVGRDWSAFSQWPWFTISEAKDKAFQHLFSTPGTPFGPLKQPS